MMTHTHKRKGIVDDDGGGDDCDSNYKLSVFIFVGVFFLNRKNTA